MQKSVLVLVLQKYEKLEKLLCALTEAGIHGATVIHSAGMVQVLSHETDVLLGSLRAFLEPDREDNRTIFILLNEDKIEVAKNVIHDIIGPLDKPETGILFILPTIYTEGTKD